MELIFVLVVWMLPSESSERPILKEQLHLLLKAHLNDVFCAASSSLTDDDKDRTSSEECRGDHEAEEKNDDAMPWYLLRSTPFLHLPFRSAALALLVRDMYILSLSPSDVSELWRRNATKRTSIFISPMNILRVYGAIKLSQQTLVLLLLLLLLLLLDALLCCARDDTK